MNKREIITLFRDLYPALAIPTDMRKIRTGYAALGPGERVVGIERLRSTAYVIALDENRTPKPCMIDNVVSWDDLKRRRPIARMWPTLIVNDYHDHAKGVDYQQFYLRE
jgi:hypothetical protein